MNTTLFAMVRPSTLCPVCLEHYTGVLRLGPVKSYAVVEELAFLVKDNLPSKHLILSMEEALVNYLQDDPSSEGILEMEPMDPYSRLLLHRLADIFGFAHESVGEGDNRRLILERCTETSIPSILVSDILWQNDEPQMPTTSHHLLRRTRVSAVNKMKTTPFPNSFEEREAAYLAARERIFSANSGEVKEPTVQKPRSVPVVARRMIAHALGQRIKTRDENTAKCESQGELPIDLNIQGLMLDSKSKASQQNVSSSGQELSASSLVEGITLRKEDKISVGVGTFSNGRNGDVIDDDNLKREHLGAAKRMFANALGLHAGKNGYLQKESEKDANKHVS